MAPATDTTARPTGRGGWGLWLPAWLVLHVAAVASSLPVPGYSLLPPPRNELFLIQFNPPSIDGLKVRSRQSVYFNCTQIKRRSHQQVGTKTSVAFDNTANDSLRASRQYDNNDDKEDDSHKNKNNSSSSSNVTTTAAVWGQNKPPSYWAMISSSDENIAQPVLSSNEGGHYHHNHQHHARLTVLGGGGGRRGREEETRGEEGPRPAAAASGEGEKEARGPLATW